MEIDRVDDFVGRSRLLEIKMRGLGKRMDAGIGASGALHQRLDAAKGPDCLFQALLDRHAILLTLPADETGAFIFDGDPISRHDALSALVNPLTRPRGEATQEFRRCHRRPALALHR